MPGRIVEIAEEGRHLSVRRGFLVVKEDREELGRVPLDDLAAVIANSHALTFSNRLLLALAERKVPPVVCGSNHMPAALFWPLEGHHRQAQRMAAQVALSKPRQKQIWQQIVRAKISAQAEALESIGENGQDLAAMAARVKSGDPDNLEAQAARRYWPRVLGSDFRRDRKEGGANSLLNYGYAVLRATVARAVMGSGLHPGFGIHHHSQANNLPLLDDLMEPFRPCVDLAVWNLVRAGQLDLAKPAKAYLAGLADWDFALSGTTSPLSLCIEALAGSFARLALDEAKTLVFPDSLLPLEPPDPPNVGDGREWANGGQG